MALLLDLGDCCDDHVDAALEALVKAQGDGAPGEMWAPHPNPLIRRIVELFTERGLARSEALTAELQLWLDGKGHRPDMQRAPRPDGAMERWAPAELRLVRTYLEALRPDEFSLDDWLMLIDYLVQRYLPTDDLRSEAEWLSTRTAFMGRVQAALDVATEAEADTILTAMGRIPPPPVLDPVQRAVVEFGRARCADRVVAVSEQTRHRLRNIIVDHQEAVFLGAKAGAAESIQSKLLDAEGLLNRDWRRIAITEATENAGQGFIASCKPGDKVRRVEKYSACPFCRSIDGTILTVVAPDAADKDGKSTVWVGKTNAGRSASPHKRGPDGLEERDEEERFWTPAGAVHSHCRGGWEKVNAKDRVDPDFEAWLAAAKAGRA